MTHTGMGAFTSACLTDADPRTVVAQCRTRFSGAPGGANLGFLYVTDALVPELDPLLEALRAVTGVQHWVGSSGIGICADDREIYDAPAAAIMLGAFAPDSWMALAPGDFTAVLGRAGAWQARFPGGLGLVHAHGSAAVQDGHLQRLNERLGDTFFVGGLSSGDAASHISDTAAQSGLSGALFAPEVAVAVDHTQGCTPIGPRHRISSAERNIAITLDERPALDVLREDVGEIMARDLSRAGNYIFAALGVPGSDTGDYMVRNLIGVDETHGLIAIGDYLDEHTELMFCRRDGNSAREDLERMTHALRRRIGNRPIRGGVYVSCLARGRHQFGSDSEEVRTIQDTLGRFPLVGFFANGEIYNGRLYGYTGVLTLFI